MSKSWYPTKDSLLLPFAQNISTRISATPAVYGVLAGDATLTATLVGNLATALPIAQNPATRTSVTVAAKDIARASLIAQLKYLYKKFNAALLSADKREELGLPIKDVTPSPIPAPSTRPVVNITQVVGRTLSLRVADELTPSKRGRPYGTSGLEVFSFAAPSSAVENPPSDLGLWKFEGLSTRALFDVSFANSIAIGTRVWICCRWYSQRGEAGPVSDTASAYVTGGIAEAA
jgi:hypothetical protein